MPVNQRLAMHNIPVHITDGHAMQLCMAYWQRKLGQHQQDVSQSKQAHPEMQHS